MQKVFKIFLLFSCLFFFSCAYDFIRLGTIAKFMKDEKIALIWYHDGLRDMNRANAVAERLRNMGYNVSTDIEAPVRLNLPGYAVSPTSLYDRNSQGVIESARGKQMDRIIFANGRCANYVSQSGVQNIRQDGYVLAIAVRNVKSNIAIAEDIFDERRKYRHVGQGVGYRDYNYVGGTRHVTQYQVEYTESFTQTEARLMEEFYSKFK